jgi:hypothetical protein
MGGSGSGRPRSRANLSDFIKLDAFQCGTYLGQSAVVKLQWSNGASIGYQSHADKPEAILVYQCRPANGEPWIVRQSVRLVTLPLHFGGVRVLFECPRCQWRRARFLYSVDGQFMCRPCSHLRYRSQGMSPEARMNLAINRIQRSLVSDANGGDFSLDHVPWRPKGMRRRMYRRLVEQLTRLQQARDDIWNVRLFKFMRRWGVLPEDLLE